MIGCECIFNWYWLADLCDEKGIPFVLGHALYLRAIHGGKVKNDKVDSEKLAYLLRGGNFAVAYAYPPSSGEAPATCCEDVDAMCAGVEPLWLTSPTSITNTIAYPSVDSSCELNSPEPR